MPSERIEPLPAPLHVAAIEVLAANCICGPDDEGYHCTIEFRSTEGQTDAIEARHQDRLVCIAQLISQLCSRPLSITATRQNESDNGSFQVTVAIQADADRCGAGRYVTSDESLGLSIAALRAANHAGLLKPAYRASYQKFLREWAAEAGGELATILRRPASIDAASWGDTLQSLEVEGLLLEYFNRVASAAVVTAANNPRPETVLSLFDNSAWLFDERGRRRDAFTDTNLWLAWYPGIENDHLSVEEVIASMPAAPEAAIPWIVRLFENPSSWLRFRGAVDLEDHDVLHVLLGRGLQDQDEAFVLGFAMGTAKRISWLQYRAFRWVVTRLYPEPYRIPDFLLPAFDLGVQCGRETGNKNLYRQQLKRLRPLTLADARREAGIDLQVLRRYYELEQQTIPFTIASLRLP